MKEIGGYIQLDTNRGEMLHQNAVALNCGRSALAYLILSKRIKKIAIPYFMCHTISDLCRKYSVTIRYYHIDRSFLPANLELEENEWLYLANYYGQLSDDTIRAIGRQYGRVIVDNAQAYFREPVDGMDTLYTCRKFFGVADGAFLFTDQQLSQQLDQDESYDRMRFLLGRFERSASEFYSEYVRKNDYVDDAAILRMAKLTENILRGLDYKFIKETRTQNFEYLRHQLADLNLLDLSVAEGACAYPLLMENGAELRKKLIAQKVFIPTLWPNVISDLPETVFEHYLAKNILPIPCDQRYVQEDMEYLCRLIRENI